jgi:hypothetical protein
MMTANGTFHLVADIKQTKNLGSYMAEQLDVFARDNVYKEFNYMFHD